MTKKGVKYNIIKCMIPDTGDSSSEKTEAELQTPTGATGIYAGWNDSVWNFGSSTQLPTISTTP